jgi:hypothetical protein
LEAKEMQTLESLPDTNMSCCRAQACTWFCYTAIEPVSIQYGCLEHRFSWGAYTLVGMQ